ncbi:MAG: hypothetical protein RLY16_3006, partial [Bacteroidota bacterium]
SDEVQVCDATEADERTNDHNKNNFLKIKIRY